MSLNMHRNDFIFSIRELRHYLLNKGIKPKQIRLPVGSISNFSFLSSKYYLDLIDWKNLDDPLRKMVIPDMKENKFKGYELSDPIGDKSHAPVPGIIHCYPDRCLLNLTSACGIHCRFCFRRNLLCDNQVDVFQSIKYIADHSKIWEVILSGGDPLAMTDEFLKRIMVSLKKINHVKVIRFHTRIPVVYPKRITEKMRNILGEVPSLIIVIHINHHREITSKFVKTVERLKQTKAMLLSQTVLLKGVNDDAETLIKLFKGLVELGIKPYYLHHLDLVKGTDHFRISVEKGKAIFCKIRENISGVCIPEYVIDLPGGTGKIPVFWLKETAKNVYKGKNYQQEKISYLDAYKDSGN